MPNAVRLTSGEERAPTRRVILLDSELSLDVDTLNGGMQTLSRRPRTERIFHSLLPSDDPEEPLAFDDVAPKQAHAPFHEIVAVAQGGAYSGGRTDKRGKPRRSLQAYLRGDADYVALAFDRRLYETGVIQYGDAFRIHELDVAYAIAIPCRAVDAGDACAGRGFQRVDVCVKTSRDALDPLVNGPFTLLSSRERQRSSARRE